MDLPQEEIAAGRLTLRPTDERDIDDIARACDDELSARFLPLLPSPYTRADAEWWVREGAPARWAAGAAQFTVLEDDRLVGSLGFPRHDLVNDVVEVGYWVAPWARGRGVATTATRAATEWAFGHGAARVELLADRRNSRASGSRSGPGFSYEGVRRAAGRGRTGDHHDLLVWSRLATDPDGPGPRAFPDLPGGRLDDGVIVLRPRRPGDVTMLAEAVSDPQARRWASRRGGDTVEEQQAAIERADSDWLTGERVQMTICDAATDAPAGDVSLFWVDATMGVVNLGYSVHPAFRRRGFATRGAARLRLGPGPAFGGPGGGRGEQGEHGEPRGPPPGRFRRGGDAPRADQLGGRAPSGHRADLEGPDRSLKPTLAASRSASCRKISAWNGMRAYQ